LAYRFGLLSGRQLREVGANLNLAPVVDLDHGVGDSIIAKYRRSLGSDPTLVANLARQIVRGMRDENIIATAKHFPSETESNSNPHEQIAVADVPLQELEQKDMLPYRALIADHSLDAIMLSHVIYKNVDPYFPASLSSEMIQTLLRRQLGYQGLVISDDLRMDAIKQYYPLNVSVVQAVNAGVDVLLVTDNLERRVMDALVLAVETGKVPMKTIDVAYGRIMATKEKYGIVRHKGGIGRVKKSVVVLRSAVPKAVNGPLLLAQKP
jgi:beta-N-acetylhexosaminidase